MSSARIGLVSVGAGGAAFSICAWRRALAVPAGLAGPGGLVGSIREAQVLLVMKPSALPICDWKMSTKRLVLPQNGGGEQVRQFLDSIGGTVLQVRRLDQIKGAFFELKLIRSRRD